MGPDWTAQLPNGQPSPSVPVTVEGETTTPAPMPASTPPSNILPDAAGPDLPSFEPFPTPILQYQGKQGKLLGQPWGKRGEPPEKQGKKLGQPWGKQGKPPGKQGELQAKWGEQGNTGRPSRDCRPPH
ncbi:hypothetical protein ACA910_021586 [Epithemia clementina (nom. ined.)]